MFRASHYIVYSYTTVNGFESMLNDAFVLQTCECSTIPPRRHHEHHPPEIAGEISLPKSSQQNPLKMTIWSPYWILHSVSQWNLQCCNNFPPPPKTKHNIIHYPEYFKCSYIYPIYPKQNEVNSTYSPLLCKVVHFCDAPRRRSTKTIRAPSSRSCHGLQWWTYDFVESQTGNLSAFERVAKKELFFVDDL